MSCLKRWCVGVTLLALLSAMTAAMADEGDPANADSPKVKHSAKPGDPKVQPQKPVMTGTLLDAGLVSLGLEGETKAKVSEALKTWKTSADEERSKLDAQKKELMEKAKAETDKDKQKALKEELAKLPKGPTDAERYKSARAALAGLLTDEQLTKLDQAVKTACTDSGLKMFDSAVANWSKAGVELNDEQKAKVQAERDKLKAELDQVELGARNMAFGAAMKAQNAVKASVLTDEQRAKVAPAKKEPAKDQPKKEAQPSAD